MTLLPVMALAAQSSGAAGEKGPDTRQQLEDRLERLQQVVENRADGQEAKDARRRIQVIRRRLEQGDFQQGDVLRLRVPADSSLTGTFRVSEQRSLELPTIPDIDLSGVLYAEADSAVRKHLEKYIRNPEVRVQITRRIAILGGVQQPGFYDLPPSTTLSDALMEAGGPTGNAQLEKIKLRRDGKNVLEGRDPNLQQVTLADLGPARDDQLVVPTGGSGLGARGILGIIGGVSGTAFALSQIF